MVESPDIMRPLILSNAKFLSMEFGFASASFEEFDVVLRMDSSSALDDVVESQAFVVDSSVVGLMDVEQAFDPPFGTVPVLVPSVSLKNYVCHY